MYKIIKSGISYDQMIFETKPSGAHWIHLSKVHDEKAKGRGNRNKYFAIDLRPKALLENKGKAERTLDLDSWFDKYMNNKK